MTTPNDLNYLITATDNVAGQVLDVKRELKGTNRLLSEILDQLQRMDQLRPTGP